MTADTTTHQIEYVIPAVEKGYNYQRLVWLVFIDGKMTRQYTKPDFYISPIFNQ